MNSFDGQPPPLYHKPMIRCIIRLAQVIEIQQQNPMNNGFPPVFINLMMLLLSPIAAMAKTIKNLLSILTGAKKAEGTPKLPATVVITAARIK